MSEQAAERSAGTVSVMPRHSGGSLNPFSTGPASATPGNALVASSEARAVAEIQTQYLMAERFPRDERAACDRILNAFSRSGLAAVAEYEYSKGGSDIQGLSIRAAEAMAQAWGNMEFGFSELSRFRGPDGVMVSLVRARAVDLQTRVIRPIEFNVRHWRDTKKGGYEIKDERDIYELMANQAQRRVRACILALIPGDVQDAARDQARTTLKADIDTSPAGIEKMLKAFGKFGVEKDHIEEMIQRRLDTIQPGQMARLQRIHASLKDGMSEAGDWFEMGDPPPEARSTSTIEANLAERRQSRQRAKAADKADSDAPPLSYAQVLDRINAATTQDILDVAGDAIGMIAAPEQRKELSAAYRRRSTELQGAQQ